MKSKKNISHGLRYLCYGIQILKHSKIVDIEETNKLHFEIMEEKFEDWEEFEWKYRPFYEKYSTLVENIFSFDSVCFDRLIEKGYLRRGDKLNLQTIDDKLRFNGEEGFINEDAFLVYKSKGGKEVVFGKLNAWVSFVLQENNKDNKTPFDYSHIVTFQNEKILVLEKQCLKEYVDQYQSIFEGDRLWTMGFCEKIGVKETVKLFEISVNSSLLLDKGEKLTQICSHRKESLSHDVQSESKYNHKIMNECWNGIVLHHITDNHFKVICRTFEKSIPFNTSKSVLEKMENPLNFDKFEIYKKLGGFLAVLYFFGGQWRVMIQPKDIDKSFSFGAHHFWKLFEKSKYVIPTEEFSYLFFCFQLHKDQYSNIYLLSPSDFNDLKLTLIYVHSFSDISSSLNPGFKFHDPLPFSNKFNYTINQPLKFQNYSTMKEFLYQQDPTYF
eukprot:TRINITY_DN9221_c0_g1_i1.p1 TRINITY_DN9221_c0_g1~~TRINITY_DN9221_c0_g1_i1.p1  ORF type:complete len:441 (-),score=109.15 TRINITY_DN9221_c0_g1_i1:365-1687(-)